MDVIAKARELGALLQQDERYLKFAEVQKANEEDKELNELIARIQLVQMSFQHEASKEHLVMAENAYKVKFKYSLDSAGDKQETHAGYYLVDFPKFEKNKKGDYDWVYKKEYYCMNNNYEIADYDGEICREFRSIGIEKKWCNLYKNSKLSEVSIASDLCGKL